MKVIVWGRKFIKEFHRKKNKKEKRSYEFIYQQSIHMATYNFYND
jgi:hypothetical protein